MVKYLIIIQAKQPVNRIETLAGSHIEDKIDACAVVRLPYHSMSIMRHTRLEM